MTASWDLASATAVILAGGLGTRLRSVVADYPKVLATVQGRPFLSYLFDQIGSAGLRRVVLCTGHLGSLIHATYGDSYEGLSIVYSHESQPAGTGGALRLAHPHVDSSSALVLNGDSYCDVDLFDLWSWHHVRPAHVSIVTATVPDARSFGRISVDEGGRIVRFAEKTPLEGPGRINAGIYLLHTALLGRIPEDLPVSLENDLLPRWIDSGGVFAYPTHAPFLDIGTPERFARADAFVRSLQPDSDSSMPTGARALSNAQGAFR